jgi:hypothetical protein
VQYLERIIALLKPYLPKVQYPEKLRRIKEFLAFSEQESICVEQLSILGRELRNAR